VSYFEFPRQGNSPHQHFDVVERLPCEKIKILKILKIKNFKFLKKISSRFIITFFLNLKKNSKIQPLWAGSQFLDSTGNMQGNNPKTVSWRSQFSSNKTN